MFKDSDEQGAVGVVVPPVHRWVPVSQGRRDVYLTEGTKSDNLFTLCGKKQLAKWPRANRVHKMFQGSIRLIIRQIQNQGVITMIILLPGIQKKTIWLTKFIVIWVVP